MFPELTVRRPHGALPRLDVRKRTVVEYQPGWLLLALPVVLVARSRRRAPGGGAGTQVLTSPTADIADSVAPHSPARRGPVHTALAAVGVRRAPSTATGPSQAQITEIRHAASSVQGVPLP